MSKTVKQGSDRERSDLGELFDWVKVQCRLGAPAAPHERQEKRFSADAPPDYGRGVGIARGRKCVRCGKRKVYRDIKTMDWCEPCIWDFVKEDQELPEVNGYAPQVGRSVSGSLNIGTNAARSPQGT